MYFIKGKVIKNISDTSAITVNKFLILKTVGHLSDRYRLVHWWVSEMMLNVQSVLS